MEDLQPQNETLEPQVEQPVQEEPQEVAENSNADVESSQEDGQDRNWKQARQRIKEKEEESKYLKQQVDLLAQQLNDIRGHTKKQPEPEETQWLTDTERRLANEIKELKQNFEKQKEKEGDYLLDRLKMKFPDFEHIVTAENVIQLKRDNPVLAKAIASLQGDQFEQGVAAYEILKRSGYTGDGQTMYDKSKIDKNQKKPVSVQAVRKEGALGEANRFAMGLTPDLAKQLNKEMADACKRG